MNLICKINFRCFVFLTHNSEPRLENWSEDMDKRIYKSIAVGRGRGFLATGDPLVIVTGWKSGSGYTNTMRLINVPETNDGPILGTPVIAGYND